MKTSFRSYEYLFLFQGLPLAIVGYVLLTKYILLLLVGENLLLCRLLCDDLFLLLTTPSYAPNNLTVVLASKDLFESTPL